MTNNQGNNQGNNQNTDDLTDAGPFTPRDSVVYVDDKGTASARKGPKNADDL
jgi:hypothetical protein